MGLAREVLGSNFVPNSTSRYYFYYIINVVGLSPIRPTPAPNKKIRIWSKGLVIYSWGSRAPTRRSGEEIKSNATPLRSVLYYWFNAIIIYKLYYLDFISYYRLLFIFGHWSPTVIKLLGDEWNESLELYSSRPSEAKGLFIQWFERSEDHHDATPKIIIKPTVGWRENKHKGAERL